MDIKMKHVMRTAPKDQNWYHSPLSPSLGCSQEVMRSDTDETGRVENFVIEIPGGRRCSGERSNDNRKCNFKACSARMAVKLEIDPRVAYDLPFNCSLMRLY